MSEAVSALGGARFSGIVDLAEIGPRGMVTLRGDLALDKLAAAVQAATGAAVPATRRITSGASGQAGWMSPDELLLIVPYLRAPTVVEIVTRACEGAFVTAANVSDARALFTIRGTQARDVLGKLCPVDLHDFAVGEIRRTRAAQVAAAIWRESEDEWRLVCFRSVAQYVWDLLVTVSKPGGEVGFYR